MGNDWVIGRAFLDLCLISFDITISAFGIYRLNQSPGSEIFSCKAVYIHCYGGHGRTGIVACALLCLFIEVAPEEAVSIFNHLHAYRVEYLGWQSSMSCNRVARRPEDWSVPTGLGGLKFWSIPRYLCPIWCRVDRSERRNGGVPTIYAQSLTTGFN